MHPAAALDPKPTVRARPPAAVSAATDALPAARTLHTVACPHAKLQHHCRLLPQLTRKLGRRRCSPTLCRRHLAADPAPTAGCQPLLGRRHQPPMSHSAATRPRAPPSAQPQPHPAAGASMSLLAMHGPPVQAVICQPILYCPAMDAVSHKSRSVTDSVDSCL